MHINEDFALLDGKLFKIANSEFARKDLIFQIRRLRNIFNNSFAPDTILGT